MTPAGFVLGLCNSRRGRVVHHFAADGKQWIHFEQLEPDSPGSSAPSDALHCNMPSATIVAAMTSAFETKLRQDHRLNHKHTRNAA
jgi:hypothetical protein